MVEQLLQHWLSRKSSSSLIQISSPIQYTQIWVFSFRVKCKPMYVNKENSFKSIGQSIFYWIYLFMNFLWNSDRRVSLINLSFLASSSRPLAQFLNTTSSSHLKVNIFVKIVRHEPFINECLILVVNYV